MSKRPNSSDLFGDNPRKVAKTTHSKSSSPRSPRESAASPDRLTSTGALSGQEDRRNNSYGRHEASNGLKSPAKQIPIPTQKPKPRVTSEGILPDKSGLFTSPSPVTSGSSTPRSQQQPAPTATMAAPLNYGQTSQITGLLGEFASKVQAAASLQARRDMAQIHMKSNLDEMSRTQKFNAIFPSLSQQQNKSKTGAEKVINTLDLQLKNHLKARDRLIHDVALVIESNKKSSSDTAQLQKMASELREAKAQITSRDVEVRGLSHEIKTLREEISLLKQREKEGSHNKDDIERAHKRLCNLEDEYQDAKKQIQVIQWDIDERKDNAIWKAIDKQEVMIQNQEKTLLDDKRFLVGETSALTEKCLAFTKDIKDMKSRLGSLPTGTDIATLKGKLIDQETALSEHLKGLELRTATVKGLDIDVKTLTDSVKTIDQKLQALSPDTNPTKAINKLTEQLDLVTAKIADLEQKPNVNRLELEKELEKTNIEIASLRTEQDQKDKIVEESMAGLHTDLGVVSAELQDYKDKTEASITELQNHLPSTASVRVKSPGPLQSGQLWPLNTNGFSSSQPPFNGQTQDSHPATPFHHGAVAPTQGQGNVNMSKLVELGARVNALSEAVQFLEDRYNNISTEYLYRRIVLALHERFPNTADAQEEIKRVYTRLASIQGGVEAVERECRSTSQLAGFASSNADEAKANYTKGQEDLTKLQTEYKTFLKENITNVEKVTDAMRDVEEVQGRLDQLEAGAAREKDSAALQNAEARNMIGELDSKFTRLDDDTVQLKETVTEFKSKLLGVESNQTSMDFIVDEVRSGAAKLVAGVVGKMDNHEERIRALEV